MTTQADPSANIGEQVKQWLRDPIFEVMPLSKLETEAASLPEGARVHVTRSPVLALEDSLAIAERLAARRPDLRICPHVAARRVRDRSHLAAIVDDLSAHDIHAAFIVSGDDTDTPAGSYRDGFAVLTDLRELAPDFGTVGVPGYPDGHPFIERSTLDAILRQKAALADSISTQMCFDVDAVIAWLQHLRADGITLPVYIGVPGIIGRIKLVSIATRIGVGASTRFLRQHHDMARSLTGGKVFEPDGFLTQLATTLQDNGLSIGGLHVNTFNQIHAFEKWRQQVLATAD